MIPSNLNPEEIRIYQRQLALVEAEESYSGFLATETELISEMDQRHLERRQAFIREAIIAQPASGNPTETIDCVHDAKAAVRWIRARGFLVEHI